MAGTVTRVPNQPLSPRQLPFTQLCISNLLNIPPFRVQLRARVPTYTRHPTVMDSLRQTVEGLVPQAQEAISSLQQNEQVGRCKTPSL